MKVVVCIPARYESTRFPGKMLADKTGKFLIQHTYEQACKAQLPQDVIIAADDERIIKAAESFGAPCLLTSRDHQSGTDRIAEATANLETDIVVNLQGDEPEIDPDHIDRVAELLLNANSHSLISESCSMATLSAPLETAAQVANPNIVKVVTDVSHRALYFSRSVLPYDRDAQGVGLASTYRRHIGMYAYRKDFLKKITSLPQTPLEKLEKLEQLRVLEHGFDILVGCVDQVADGIDTPEQYDSFVKRYQSLDSTSAA